jgi:hypothetical protein
MNKKEKPEKLEVYSDASEPNAIIINGRKFAVSRITTKKIDHTKHFDKIIFKEKTEEDIQKKQKKLDFIASKIGAKMLVEDFVKEFLKAMDGRTLTKIYNLIREKKKVRVHHGCLGVQIGDKDKGCYLPFFD